ncbi:MAG: hypothetical protein VW547_01245 [Alphaproteobacteria bacterium]
MATIAQLSVTLGLDDRKFKKGLSEAATAAKNFTGKIGMVTTALVGAGAAIGKFAERGTKVTNVAGAFEKKVGDLDAALMNMRTATRGLVSDYELMEQANLALTMGSVKNVTEFNTLAKTAQTLGRALGVDAAFALQSLNVGMARQSKLILDNLGLMIDVEKANRNYATALGTTVDKLTDAQKAEAFRVEVMSQAKTLTEGLGESTYTAGDAFRVMVTELKNTADGIAQTVAGSEALTKVFGGLANIVRRLREDVSAGGLERLKQIGEETDLGKIIDLTAKLVSLNAELKAVQPPGGEIGTTHNNAALATENYGTKIEDLTARFADLGIKEKDIGAMLQALNARFLELTANTSGSTEATKSLQEQFAALPAITEPLGILAEQGDIARHSAEALASSLYEQHPLWEQYWQDVMAGKDATLQYEMVSKLAKVSTDELKSSVTRLREEMDMLNRAKNAFSGIMGLLGIFGIGGTIMNILGKVSQARGYISQITPLFTKGQDSGGAVPMAGFSQAMPAASPVVVNLYGPAMSQLVSDITVEQNRAVTYRRVARVA